MEMNIEKWKKAVIHLECTTDSESYHQRIERMDCLRKSFENGEIDSDEYSRQISSKSRDVRFHGTAIFLIKNDRRYLITARHVVWDEISAKFELEEHQKRNSQIMGALDNYYIESALNRIFYIIFRVPSINEIGQNLFQEFLMNLGAGPSSTHPYTFSDPENDLAIISLDQNDSGFADELISQGFEPISIEDIGSEPRGEGVDAFTVGYPSATALLAQLPKTSAELNWASSYVSVPVCSFGKISMLNENLDFFWTDMSIYPGNSGGPIICDGKLVGIVSAQATIQIEDSENLRTRIPFGKIIKAKLLFDLISQQEIKDQDF